MWGNLLRNAAALATESAQNIVGNLDEIASKASNLLETLDQGIGNGEEEENVDSAGEDVKELSNDVQEEAFIADNQQIGKSDPEANADVLNDSMLNTSLELHVDEHDHIIPHKSDAWDTVSDIASIQLQVGDIKEKHEKLLKSASALDSENQKMYLELSAQHRATVEKYKTKREECKRLEFDIQLKNNDLMVTETKLMEMEKQLQQLMDQNAHLTSFVAEIETQRDKIVQQLQIQREENRRQVDALKSEKKTIINCLATLEESLPEEGIKGISENDLLDKVDTSDYELHNLFKRLVYKFMASAVYSEKSDEKYKTAMETISAMEKEISHFTSELSETKPMVKMLSKENEALRNELASVQMENNRVEENSNEIQRFKEDIQRLEEEIEALQIEKKMIQEAFDSKVEEYEGSIAEWRQTATDADDRVQDIEDSMSKLREEMESKIHALENPKAEEVQFQSIQSEAKIQSLLEEIEIIKAELKTMETENHTLKDQLKLFHHERTVRDIEKTDIEHKNASIEKLEDKLTLAKEKRHKLMEEITDLSKEKAYFQQQLQESLEIIATTSHSAEQLKEKFSSLEEENKKLSESLSQFQSTQKITVSINDETNEELKAMIKILEEKSQRVEELEWEQGDAQSRIAEFEQLVARLNTELSCTQKKQLQLEAELANIRLVNNNSKKNCNDEENKKDSDSNEKLEDITLFENSLDEANETIAILRQQLSLLENQREETQQQEIISATLNDRNEEKEEIALLKNTIEELLKEKEALETALGQLHFDISKAQQESENLVNDRTKALQEELLTVSDKFLKTEALVFDQQCRIEQLEQEIAHLSVAYEQSTTTAQGEAAIVGDLTEKLSLLTSEKKIVDEKLISLQKEISNSERLLHEKQEELVKLQATENELKNAENEELIAQKASLDIAQELNKECEQSIANLQDELEFLKDELQQLNQRYLEEIERAKNVNNEVVSLKADKANLEAQLNEATATANQKFLEFQKASEKESVQSIQQIIELTSIAEMRNKEILELQGRLEYVLSQKNEAESQAHELQERIYAVSEEKIAAEEKILFLQEEMINVQSTVAAKNEEITRLEAVWNDATRWEREHQATLQALEAREKESNELQAQFELSSADKEKDYLIQLQAKEVEIAALSEQIQSLQDSLRSQEATWSATVQSKAEECLSLAMQVQSLQETVASLRQEADARAQQQHLLEAAYAEAQLKTVALESSHETWKSTAQDLQQTLLHLQDAYDVLTKEEMPGLHTANATLSEEVTFLQQEQRRWVSENDHFRSRISQSEQSLQTTQRDLQQAQQKLQHALSWETRATQAEDQLKKLNNKKKKDLEMLKKQNEKINLLQQELHMLRDQQHQQQQEQDVSMPPAVAATTKMYTEAEWEAHESTLLKQVKALQEEYYTLQKEFLLKQDRCDSLERHLLQLEEEIVKHQGELEASRQEITFLEQDIAEWKAKAEAVAINNNTKDAEEEQEKAQQQSQVLSFLQTQVQELQMAILVMREQHAQALQAAQDKAQIVIADLHKQTSHWKRENARLMEDVHHLEQKLETQQDMHTIPSNNNVVSENIKDSDMDMEAGSYVSTSDSNVSSTNRVKNSANSNNNYQYQLNRMMDEGKTLMDLQHGTTLLVLADDKKDLAGLHPWMIQLWAMLRQKCASYPWLLAILGERPPRLSTSAQLLLLYVLLLHIYVLYLRSFGCYREAHVSDTISSTAPTGV